MAALVESEEDSDSSVTKRRSKAPEDELEIFKTETLQAPVKKIGDAKIKKLKIENKQLKEKIKEFKHYISSDKILIKLKQEYNECVADCKSIMEQLENKLHQNILSDAGWSE